MTRLPFVFINMAMTADGKIAAMDSPGVPIGSPRDTAHLYQLRARADAILCGARTVEAGPVILDAGPERYRRQRLKAGRSEYPLRIVASGAASLDPGAELFKHRFSPIIILTTKRASRARLRKLESVSDLILTCGDGAIDWQAAWAELSKHCRINSLLCEGGGTLNDSLLRARVVSEIHLTICPYLLGGRNAPTIADGLGTGELKNATNLRQIHRTRRGNEIFLTYQVLPPK